MGVRSGLALGLWVYSAVLFAAVSEQTLEGCGATQQAASQRLAENISSRVSQQISQHTTSGGQQFSSVKLRVSTDVGLQKVRYKTGTDQWPVCAYIRVDEQTDIARQTVKRLAALQVTQLPLESTERLKQLDQWIAELDSYYPLVFTFLKTDIQQLDEKRQHWVNARSVLSGGIFEGCGARPAAAKIALLQAVNPLDKNTKAPWPSYVSLAHKLKKKQQHCLRLQRTDLQEHVTNALESLQKTANRALPDQQLGVLRLLAQAQTLVPLASVFKADQGRLLTTLQGVISQLLIEKKRYERTLVFVLNHTADSQHITVSLGEDRQKSQAPYTFRNLRDRVYSYRIVAEKHCEVSGTVDLRNNEPQSVSIDLSRYRYPEVSFHSNDKTATVYWDNQQKDLAEVYAFSDCRGEHDYRFKRGEQQRSGRLRLNPGLKRQLREDFLDKITVQNFARFLDSEQLVVRSLWATENEQQGLHLGYLKSSQRHLAYGVSSAVFKNVNKYRMEVAAQGVFRLTQGAGQQDPASLLGRAVFPWLAVELGGGYDQLLQESYKVGAVSVGLDVVMNDYWSLGLMYRQNRWDKQQSYLGLGLQLGIAGNALTGSEREQFRDLLSAFNRQNHAQWHYVRLQPQAEFAHLPPLEGNTISWLTAKDYLQYGYTLLYAESTSSKAVEWLFGGDLKLLRLGGKGDPLVIFNALAIVPFVGIEVGLGYHQHSLDDTVEAVSTFGDHFLQDYGIARLRAGLSVPFNDFLGFNAVYAKSFSMDQSTLFSVGLSVKVAL